MEKEISGLVTYRNKDQDERDNLRQKLRVTRQELDHSNRQLLLAQKTIDRLSSDRSTIEATVTADKEQLRKLEAKLVTARPVGGAGAALAAAQEEASQLHKALEHTQKRMEDAERECERYKQENSALLTGIEIAAEELTRRSGTDISARLLEGIGRAKDEASRTQSCLESSKQKEVHVREALEQARRMLESQHETLVCIQTENGKLKSSLEASEEELKSEKAVAMELKTLVDALRPKAGAIKQQRDALRKSVELEVAARKAVEAEAVELRQTVEQCQAEIKGLRSELRRLMALEGGQQYLSPLLPQAGKCYPPTIETTKGGEIEGKEHHCAPNGKLDDVSIVNYESIQPTSRPKLASESEIENLERELVDWVGHEAHVNPREAISSLQTFHEEEEEEEEVSSDSCGPTKWRSNPLAKSEEVVHVPKREIMDVKKPKLTLFELANIDFSTL